MKYNLGCGEKLLSGYVNVDICGHPDVNCDLSQFPWPLDTESADEIYSEHFLEHVVDYEKTIFEMHRVLKPGGVLHFKVPHFRSIAFPWHLHHYAFSSVTCKLLCESRPYMFGGRKLFDFVSIRFNYLGFLRPSLCRIFSWAANRWQGKWEYFGLPIDEIEFVARKCCGS